MGRKQFLVCGGGCVLLLLFQLSLRAQYIDPQPYLDFDAPAAGDAVSPFLGIDFDYFYLEDFEDSALNTPGVTLLESADLSGPSFAFSDSVDGDDGVIDGLANGTQSLFSNFSVESFTFNFSRAELGELPTHAGIVWTDVGRNGGGAPFSANLVDNVVFEAFGAAGNSLGSIGPFSLGDASISRTTEEDRFIGVVHPAGISSIRLTMPGLTNWEADHLQYGFDAATSTGLPGDYSGDGFVSQPDLDLVLLNWGETTIPAGWVNTGQFDGVQVSQNELDGVLLNWGSGTPPISSNAAVPEPAALWVLLGMGLWGTRRR